MYADIQPLVQNELEGYFESYLNEPQKSRVEKALEENYKAYPLVKGSYKVYSFGEESNHYYTRHPRKKQSHCGCPDYFYTCGSDNSDISKCKHLWRVWLEVYAGLIPPETEYPYEWLVETVENEIFELIEENPDEEEQSDEVRQKISQLKALHDYLDNDRTEIDLEKAYDSWAIYMGVNIEN